MPAVVERWISLGDASLATSIFCEAEVLQGLMKKDSARLWELYRRSLLDRLTLLPFDRRVAERYASLKVLTDGSGSPRPVFDLLIAATALENGLVLVTLDSNHFEAIPGLAVEDWQN